VPLAVYVITGLLVAADAVVPALPAEVVVVGTTAQLVEGPLSGAAFVAVVALGSFAGQCAVFLATRRLARRWLGGHDRWSRHIGPDSPVGRWGPRGLLVAGFLPGGRLAAAASVGVSSVRARRFAVAAAIGSTLGATYLVALGTTAHRLVGTSVWTVVVSALAVALLGCLAGWLVRAFSSRRARHRWGIGCLCRARADPERLPVSSSSRQIAGPMSSPPAATALRLHS
jgi:membrane protein DedA with SNARE-associated domain